MASKKKWFEIPGHAVVKLRLKEVQMVNFVEMTDNNDQEMNRPEQ